MILPVDVYKVVNLEKPSEVLILGSVDLFDFAFERLQEVNDAIHRMLLVEYNAFTYFNGADNTESNTEIIENIYGARKILETIGYSLESIPVKMEINV